MSSILFLATILGLSWRCFALDPIVRPTDLITRVGCNVTRECSGKNVMEAGWSTRRTKITFTNSTSRMTWNIVDGNLTTAVLAFTNISTDDAGEYSCIILFNDGQFDIQTITVIVTGNRITISPIRNYRLDNTRIGDVITIGCVISTCGTPNTVNFSELATGKVLESITRSSDGAFNWNPTITDDLTGTYLCTAQNPLGTASVNFTLAGTPQPSPRPRGSARCDKNTLLVVLLVSVLSLLAVIHN